MKLLIPVEKRDKRSVDAETKCYQTLTSLSRTETNNTFVSAKRSSHFLRKLYQNELQASRQKDCLSPMVTVLLQEISI